jgi:hypothetical protein
MIRNIITASLIVTFTVTLYAAQEWDICRTKKDYRSRKNKTFSMKQNVVNRGKDNTRHHKKLTQTNQPNQSGRQANLCPDAMTTSEFATRLNNILLGKPNTNN